MLGWVQGAEPLARVRSGEHGHVISGSLIERYGELKRQALDCVLLMGHPRLPSVDGGIGGEFRPAFGVLCGAARSLRLLRLYM